VPITDHPHADRALAHLDGLETALTDLSNTARSVPRAALVAY
jgi:hypothetical protein